jgi:cytochrome c
MNRAWVLALVLPLSLLCGCERHEAQRARGKALLASYGCVACHTIKGLQAGAGGAGPPLEKIAGNSYIAGILPNHTAAMERWITAPRQVSPGTAMPDLGVTADEARAMAAYLYSQ